MGTASLRPATRQTVGAVEYSTGISEISDETADEGAPLDPDADDALEAPSREAIGDAHSGTAAVDTVRALSILRDSMVVDDAAEEAEAEATALPADSTAPAPGVAAATESRARTANAERDMFCREQ